uniref:transketolase n=1 Tax=Haptolina ericina TaxID=156174 RepID=A0A7S3AIK0_9EUKA
MKQGTAGVHGAPLGHADLANVKRKAGFAEAEFFNIPKDVAEVFSAAGKRGDSGKAEWDAMLERYSQAYPELASEFKRRQSGALPEGWKDQLPRWTPDDKALATRQSSQQILNKICEFIPEMVGGSADLTPSNLTKFRGALDFQSSTPEGRYIRFGVREHAMAAICNGLYAYGGLLPFCATFLNFTGYALGAMRVSALSEFGVVYIATHDSIGLGEDGPTHQPVEALLNFRATPNTITIRPADSNECSGAYMVALERRHTPSVIACSRQGCANLVGSTPEKVYLGAYSLFQSESPPQLVLVGSGSEVQLLIEAAKSLSDIPHNIISMPCWELFDAQPQSYRMSIFPPGVPVLSCEALTTEGWCKYAHYSIGMTTFGASGPAKDVQKKFGFTVENVVEKARLLLSHYADKPVPCLIDRPDLPVSSLAH